MKLYLATKQVYIYKGDNYGMFLGKKRGSWVWNNIIIQDNS